MGDNVTTIPNTQFAIQLVGPGQLKLNKQKEVFKPGPYQILVAVEAVGLCFSDLKLLKHFSGHARKTDIVSGISKEVLDQIPSYVPGDKPAVPGHECVGRIVAVGDRVEQYRVGQRFLVQADYRNLKTADSNGAFGYNFEGALQEYTLMDQRVFIDEVADEHLLVPVDEELGASAACLVEPWACVEDSYISSERQTIKAGGKMLLVADAGHKVIGLAQSLSPDGKPASLTSICSDAQQCKDLETIAITLNDATDLAELQNDEFDDIVYFGADKQSIEILNDKLAAEGIINIVTGGKKIGQEVSIDVGRVHYGKTRWIGTVGANAADSYRWIPSTGEIRSDEKIVVIGAGGPMGQMHIIRQIYSGVKGISITAADIDDVRLDQLLETISSLDSAAGIELKAVNSKTQPLNEKFSYFALMAPVPALVAEAIRNSTNRCLINVFAGIPAGTRYDLDLDKYIANQCFMFGTTGSSIHDMRIVLDKVGAGKLDTDLSVDAICGMAGAATALAAVENRTITGKIIVYPPLHDMELIRLSELTDHFPTVAQKLDNGMWCKAAEEELLMVAGHKR